MATSESAIGTVIVSYESQAVLPRLLASLARYEPETPVVVVDNASPSGQPDISAYRREGGVPGNLVDLVVLPENRGYGVACNIGVERLRRYGPRYLAFLNPDIRLAGPSLTELTEALDARPRVGVASGVVVDEEGRRVHSVWGPNSQLRALWFSSAWPGRRARALIRRLMRRGLSSSRTLLEDLRSEGHVLGGVMVVRAVCFDEVHGFDEDFFLYWGDADLCERIRVSGAEVRILDCTPFVHAPASGSKGIDDEQRWEWYSEGARTFARKHLSPGQAQQLEAALELGHRLRQLRTQRPSR
ncbi:MAG: glycosyltransferase [Nitriliruptorales bacterium]